jgi:hypothetical protein
MRLNHSRNQRVVGVATSVLVALLWILQARTASAQDLPAPEESIRDSVMETRALLLAAFPEAQRQGLSWRITETADGFVIEARPSVNLMSRAAAPVLLSAAVKADENDRVMELRTGGPLIASVRQKVATLAGRSSAEVETALRAANATLLPSDQASDAKVVGGGLKHALRATVMAVNFDLTAPETGADAVAWTVELERGGEEGGNLRASVDPIEGRLLSLIRR